MTADDLPRPVAVLVSFHYLKAALWRRRSFCLLSAVLGVLLGGLFLLVTPEAHTASTTLVLSHDTQVDPARAMATDVSLLATRTVAEHTISELGLALTPEDFAGSLTAVPTTSDVLVLTLAGPTDAEARRRLTAFTSAYLRFRATQVTAQSDALIQGYRARTDSLQTQVGELSRRIEVLSNSGDDGTGRLSDVITQRAQLMGQIGDLEESVQDTTLRRNAIVSASRIIDPAASVPGGGLRTVVLALLSGLIGGAALGLGLVVLRAILSDRLRLRVEVASALEAPVPVTVGRIAPRPLRLLTAFPPFSDRERRRVTDLDRMAHGLVRALPAPGGRRRLAVACLDNADEVGLGVIEAAAVLRQRGLAVRIVDLTAAGGVEKVVARRFPGSDERRPAVSRPAAVPCLARGPVDLAGPGRRAPGDGDGDGDGDGEERIVPPGPSGVLLVLADLDPGIGADHLAAWADRVVVAVTGGRSSVERVRTAGELVRSAGLDLHAGLLVRAEPDDASSGSARTRSDLDGGAGSFDGSLAGSFDGSFDGPFAGSRNGRPSGSSRS